MTRDEARAMAALMLAYADGKTVQQLSHQGWLDLSNPAFQAHLSHYRIKPEPKEAWVNECLDGSGLSYKSKHDALQFKDYDNTRVAVHYREVCDE